MADNGEYYSMMTPEFAEEMRALCRCADIITPNLTEAAFLLGKPYDPCATRETVEVLLRELVERFGVKKAVITGISFDKDTLGAAAIDGATGAISYAFTECIRAVFHGTGDIFCSTLICAVAGGKPIAKAIRIAMNFTLRAIQRTLKAGTDLRLGVQFEPELPYLIRRLGLMPKL